MLAATAEGSPSRLVVYLSNNYTHTRIHAPSEKPLITGPSSPTGWIMEFETRRYWRYPVLLTPCCPQPTSC